MKKSIYGTLRSLLIVFVIITMLTSNLSVIAAAEDEPKPLDGKTISILGDSISTFENVSCGEASLTSNSTIKNNRLFYTDGRNGVHLEDTWWMQITEELGGSILVNNSYSGSCVYDAEKDADSHSYQSRATQLHDDTGENKGQKPDIILVYMGYNDYAYSKSKLGTFEQINFDTLIRPENDAVFYTKPQTSCEAYAIMMHKICNAYPDAEVYCFNLAPRSYLTDKNRAIFEQFNTDIGKIAEKYNCILVDNYNNAGLLPNDENVYCYLADGLHPNVNGMDAITNSFLKTFYENSRYMPQDTILHPIEYLLDNVIVDQGTLKTARENDSLYCSFSSLTGGPIDIKLYLDDIDITDLCTKDYCIDLPRISGKIKIKASLITDRSEEDSYRFGIEDDVLKSLIGEENYENTLKLNSGTVADGVMQNTAYALDKTIELTADMPWSIVWKAQYTDDYKCITLSTYSKSNKEMNNLLHFIEGTSVLCMGQYKNGIFINYGIDLAKHDIDITQANEYRLSNIITPDGKNIIYLYINGAKTGAMNQHYEGNEYKGINNTWCNGKSFYYNYIGTTDNTINGCKLDFLQIWENINTEKHTHDYIYSVSYAPTCLDDGYDEKACRCGHGIIVKTADATGHTESDWITDTEATTENPGKAYKECTVCENIIDSKVLPQLTPSAPVITLISNEIDGVRIKWNVVEGADTYRVYRRGAGSKYWTYLGTTTALTFLDTSALNNNYWRYTVRSVNEGGFGAFDTNGKFIKFLSVPEITNAENTATGLNISWNKVTGATRYYIYRNRVGFTNWTLVGSTTATSYNDTSIRNANGVDYRYSVKAYNGYKSAFDTKGIIVRRLSPPTLKSAVSYPTGIYVSWTPIAGTTGYYVYRKTDKTGWRLIGSTGGTSNAAYFDKTAVKNQKYYYTVKACYGKTLSVCNTKGIACVDKY